MVDSKMICVHEEKQSKLGRTVSVGAGMTGRRSRWGGHAQLPEKERFMEIPKEDQQVILANTWGRYYVLRMPYVLGVCERKPQSIIWL